MHLINTLSFWMMSGIFGYCLGSLDSKRKIIICGLIWIIALCLFTVSNTYLNFLCQGR